MYTAHGVCVCVCVNTGTTQTVQHYKGGQGMGCKGVLVAPGDSWVTNHVVSVAFLLHDVMLL